ncbi:MAG: ATP-dependent DNA helicase II subunit 2 [Geoglossum umbratile]|nr:MAG: ATP-dependent DNA helicase II subunit 2 [Geoglossum umbratile]
MAGKEATVFIVDLGRSMGEKHSGRDETDLDWAMRYVWDKITTVVATGRKTALIGVIGLRTDETDNELREEEAFEHITVLQPISQILMPNLRDLQEKIRISGTDSGDAISAIVIAIQMITAYCKKLKYERKIVLITNGCGMMDTDDVEEITKKIKNDEMELVVLGVDFDDPEYGVKEEDKDPVKAGNESAFKALTGDCDGVFGTLEEAITELGIPRIKPVRPVPSYKGQLTLGDLAEFDTALAIDVERYPRTMIARPPSASQFIARTDEKETGGESMQSSRTLASDSGTLAEANATGILSAIKTSRIYQVDDENTAGGKREVTREELAKGYEYGRTAVHISESDENVTKLETQASMDIVGFVQKDMYERYMNMSVSCVIIAQRANPKAAMALSSFVHALFELESYAVARLVTKNDKPPVLLLLAPSIDVDYECLVDVQLPFAEDMRKYRFPPLDKVVTVSGKTLKEHRNLPTDQLMKAMSDYVDQMDLSTFGKDDEGNPTEYIQTDETYSPLLHRINQAVRWRAVHPWDPVPPISEILTKYAHPPQELLELAKENLENLAAAADVKKVPPKQKGRKRNRDQPNPLSGLNVEELLGRQKRTRISTENAIPEFKQMLATTEDPGAIQDAAKQMSHIIISQIKHSLADSGYGRAAGGLRVMREELAALEEPGIYNDFIKDLKRKMLAGELGGDRREMWWEIRRNQLGFITKRMSGLSSVTDEEAREFLLAR